MGWADPSLGPCSLPPGVCPDLSRDLVICSPLKRATESASLVFPLAQLRLDARLKERGLGVWEGKAHKQVELEFKQALVGGIVDARYTPPQGEPLEEFAARVGSFLEDYMDSGLLVVTHNGWIRTAMWLRGRIEDASSIYSSSIPHFGQVALD